MRTPSTLNTAPTWLINQASIHATRIVNDRIGAMGAHRYQYRLLAALAFTLSMVADFTALLAALWLLSREKPAQA